MPCASGCCVDLHPLGLTKGKGTFVSESALHSFDGDKPNSVAVAMATGMIIHLIRPARGTNAWRIFIRRDATITRGLSRAGYPSSVLSCTAWGFSCLANRSASGELLPRLFTLACAFSKNRRCVFCDTFRQRPLSRTLPAYFTRHAAVWCSDFPPANRKRFTSDHLPSANNISQSGK